MKKSLTITLAVLILGALSAALWFSTSSSSEETLSTNENAINTETTKNDTNQNTTNTETSLISVLSFGSSDVNSIEVTVGSNTLTYLAGDENWTLKGYEDYLLDQSGLNYKAKVMLEVEAVRSIKDAKLSEYGLDQPSKKATYYLKDGSTVELSLGNLSLDQLAVYVMLDNDPSTVYVVDSMLYNCMIGDIDSYRTKELENYDTAGIHDMTISGKEIETLSLALSSVQNGYSISYDLTTDLVQGVLANTYSVDQLISTLPSFTVSNFVADHVTDLSVYGLDNPSLHLVINYYNASATTSSTPSVDNDFDIVGSADYIWGNILENGEIAFMKVGDTSVYSMDASFLTNLKECAKPFYLMSKYIAMPHINTVTAIDVTFDDASYHMTVDESNGKYTLANQNMDKTTFKKLYRNICGLIAEIELETENPNAPTVATITYTLSDGSTKTVTLSPSSNEQYYQTYLNDALLVGVTKAQVDTLKETLKAASAGEEFNDIY